MPTTIDSRTAPKYTPQFPFDSPEKGSLLDLLKRAHGGLQSRLPEFASKAKAIGDNIELSIEGRKRRVAELAKDQLRRIDAIMAGVMPKIERRIEELENGLRSQGERAARTDPLVAARSHLILKLLEGLDASQRLAEFKLALDQDERETMAAAASAPKLWQRRYVPPAILEVLERESLKRAAPAAYRELEELRSALAIVKETRQIVESYIRSEAGLQPDFATRVRADAAKASA